MKTSFQVPVRIRSTVVGAIAALAVCSSANAFTKSIGDLSVAPSPGSAIFLGLASIDDTILFSLSSSSLASFTITPQSLDLGFVIPGATGVSFSLYKGIDLLAGPGTSFAGLSLDAGTDYSFKVTGPTSGLYSVNWYVSPVPEPESYALALAGMGAVISLMRRRRDTDRNG
ncbi:PEP-CTERM sorting domain-containing protein [Aquabacterium sp.]|uniref:PEP-CTERM sorting domain-containing protein n=1 Tax=Aquabacterium sp. TaxID=1872578 RepID=UPI003D6D2ED8